MAFFASGREMEEILREFNTFEFTIDVIWCITILKTFITAFKRDVDYESDWKKIFYNYAIKGAFIFDLLSCVPFLVFQNASPAWYFMRLLRFYRLSTFRNILKELICNTCEKCDKSKMITQKIMFITDFICMLVIVIHLLACLWIYVGV